jgi:hypothetical protein
VVVRAVIFNDQSDFHPMRNTVRLLKVR